MDKEIEEILRVLNSINDKLYRIAKKLGCYEEEVLIDKKEIMKTLKEIEEKERQEERELKEMKDEWEKAYTEGLIAGLSISIQKINELLKRC